MCRVSRLEIVSPELSESRGESFYKSQITKEASPRATDHGRSSAGSAAGRCAVGNLVASVVR
jgi:hypothetical protein